MSCAALRSSRRSGPKTLTAIWARTPDMMWSSRCEIGWPMLTFTLGMLVIRSRMSASTSSRGRPTVSMPQPCRPGIARSTA